MQIKWRAMGFCIMALPLGLGAAWGGDLRLNEVGAAQSERRLRWDANGTARLGIGPAWYAPDFSPTAWAAGPGPLGYNHAGLGTDLSEVMYARAFSLYLRREFTVTAGEAALADAVQLAMDFDGGFVAYLNGVEVARRNLGAPGGFVYYNQPAFNLWTNLAPETFTLGAASNVLRSGSNVLAIQGHNTLINDEAYWLAPDLALTGPAGRMLVSQNEDWPYAVGDFEPSGGPMDPALLPGRQPTNLAWTTAAFDDARWAVGPGGIGYGQADARTDVHDLVYGLNYSMYLRQVFMASPATAAATNPLVLAVDYCDGFVAYLNGQELARRNLGVPGELMAHNRAAESAHPAGVPESIVCAPARDLLVAGTNVLAVQVHVADRWGSALALVADLAVSGAGGARLAAHAADWSFWPGSQEPQPRIRAPGFYDWVEIVNTSAAPVALRGWSITDNAARPRKWLFPDVAVAGGAYQLVFCSGFDRAPTNAGAYLHTNFKLAREGQFLGLYNGQTQLMSSLVYPGQAFFHSYGWDDAAGSGRYFETPTPGAANAGIAYTNLLAAPRFYPAQGFHDAPLTVTLSNRAGRVAAIRYTLDGSDPDEQRGLVYSTPLLLTTSAVLRARAFHTNELASDIASATYLIGQPAVLRQLPAALLAGDETRALAGTQGVAAICGGAYTAVPNPYNATWYATNINDYNMPMKSGAPYERPVALGVLSASNTVVASLDCGLRFGGGDYVRSVTKPGPWTNGPQSKYSYNLYFRSDYGAKSLDAPLFAGSPVAEYDSLRLRAGHNDWRAPFYRDELARRLQCAGGQAGSLGQFLNLFVNAQYRGYYNLVERYRNEFFRKAYASADDWDVIKVFDEASEGDTVAWLSMQHFITNQDLTVASNYLAAARWLDLTNFVDYLLVEIYGCNPDWPNNNWVAARARTTNGLFRFYVWDAEQCFNPARTNGNNFLQYPSWLPGGGKGLNGEQTPLANMYRALTNNPEFRLFFADRIQRQFFNAGPLADASIAQHAMAFETELRDTVAAYFGNYTTEITNLWIPQRRAVVFRQFIEQGLWPATPAPQFSRTAGIVPYRSEVAISNPAAGGTIYYSLDGTDPRSVGGVPAGQVYTNPIVINRALDLKARVLDAGEWSPMNEALYLTDIGATLKITELMYNPPAVAGSPYDSQEYEFLELKNTGTNTINVAYMAFTNGITCTLPNLDVSPAGIIVLVRNRAAFAARYNTNGVVVAAQYSGKLANEGERLTLADPAGQPVFSFVYQSGWYPAPNGLGYSLVPTNAVPSGDPGAQAYWRVSTAINGSPGHDDPDPAPLPGLLVNEALTHTDPPQVDAIEIFNPTAAAVSLGGWWLSDDVAQPQKYAILPQELPAGGYAVFYENAGSTSSIPPECFGNAFALNSHGDGAWLFSPDLRYGHGLEFAGADNGVSFGRHVNSMGTEQFPAQATNTLGGINSPPRVGPVVLSKIMYDPPTNKHEYVELVNITATNIALYNSTNTWQVDGVGFAFDGQLALLPMQAVLLVRDTIAPAEFRTQFAVPTNVPIYSFSGGLAAAGETLTLTKPDTPDDQGVARIVVDRVQYANQAPWPVEAAGSGAALERIQPTEYGNDPVNWRAVQPDQPGVVPVFTPIPWPPATPVPTPTPTPTPARGSVGWLNLLME